MERRHERSLARHRALKLLYAGEITDASPSTIFEAGIDFDDDAPAEGRSLGGEEKIEAYTLRLVEGVEQNRDLIDGYLEEASDSWSVARMPLVDRQILRIAAFEMIFVDEVPSSVSINEAVELAKAYGGEDESHRFVNGVLGFIAKRAEEKRLAPMDSQSEQPSEMATEKDTCAHEESAAQESAVQESVTQALSHDENAAEEPLGDES